MEDPSSGPVQSGWGTWWKAFDHGLRCYAALQVIPKAAFPNEESREQFVQAVRIAAGVRHRSMASVFPLALIDDSYVYAMEFCDGETLADRVGRSGRLATLDALKIAQQMAAGLDAASAAGLFHRNIAAENVILLQEDDEISAKVLGLALPSKGAVKGLSAAPQELDFRSPEEIAGKGIDVRSGIYSLGGLLYFMEAGPEKYAMLRAKAVGDEADNLFADVEDFSHRIGVVVADTLRHDPEKRIQTFAELVDAIERAQRAPEQSAIQRVTLPPPIDEVVVRPTAPGTDVLPVPEVAEGMPLTEVATKTKCWAGELMIPAHLLQVAQSGSVLRLKQVKAKSPEQVVACVGDTFRIGRSVEADLVTRFLPRTKPNDTKTRRLSKSHVTVRLEGQKILLLDGSGVKESANGSTFDALVLSTGNPVPLVKAGELKLADSYAIKVIPLLEDTDSMPAIGNLSDWSGPNSGSDPACSGAIFFKPSEQNEVDLTVWLFSTAQFRSSSASGLDFLSFTDEPSIGALRYFRGCFWIEPRSTESLLVDGLALNFAEIAPLKTGQTVEVKGNKYSVEVQERSREAAI